MWVWVGVSLPTSKEEETVHHRQARRPGWGEPAYPVAIAFQKIIEF